MISPTQTTIAMILPFAKHLQNITGFSKNTGLIDVYPLSTTRASFRKTGHTCGIEKSASFTKFRAIGRRKHSKQHANLKFLEFANSKKNN